MKMRRKMQLIKDLRLVTNAELRAQQPQGDTPEDAKTGDQQQSDKQPKTIEGYALLFNSPSKDLGGFVEVIDPKALDDVDLSNVIMLDQHDYSKPLASVKAGTLKLDVDDKGLHFVATLDDSVSYANDAYQNVKSGNVDSMSFRFDVDDNGDQFTQDEQGNVTRTIKQVKDLFEVSTVTIPAYDDSNVQVDKRSYEEFLNTKKGEKQNMTEKTIIAPENEETKAQKEVRSFEGYIRSEGETRDGLTTDGNGVLIPSEVITPIFQSKKGTNRLSDYATVKQVSVGQGSYPIAGNDPSKVLATKAENAAIGDVDPEVTGVEFKTQTRAGKVYLSQELVDDNAIDFSSEIQAQMAKLVDNTDNAQILAKLKTLSPVVVKSVDAIKQAKNTKLDPSLQPVVVVNQSAFNWLDTQKDSEDRYLMSEDIQAPTGRSLFGLPVVELSDAQLPNVDTGKFPAYIGDLAETIAIFRRNQVTTKWTQFDSYSQGLAIMLRNDYQFIDKTATVALTIDTTPGK